MTKTQHQSWPLVNLMEDAARPFYEGPTERTAECVHIVVLKKRRAMGIVLLPDLGLCFFFFFFLNEQSNKDIAIQIKNVKYDFDLT